MLHASRPFRRIGIDRVAKPIYPIWYLSLRQLGCPMCVKRMFYKIVINCANRRVYQEQYIEGESSARSQSGVIPSTRFFLGGFTLVYALGLSASASPGFAQEKTPPTAQLPIYEAEIISIPAENVPENFSMHGQFTNVTQYHPPFTSPFYGPNSLIPGHRGNETIELTLFAGLRVWDGLEAYVNPEVDQGFGLSNTLGVAGFPSGEAYKIGNAWADEQLTRTQVGGTPVGGTATP